MAAIITSVIGKTVTAKRTSISQMKTKAQISGAPKDKISQMIIMNNHYNEFGFLGNSKIFEMVLNRKPTNFLEYVTKHHATFTPM